MSYTLHIEKKVSRQIEKFPKNIIGKILEAFDKLQMDPRCLGSKKLQGRDGYRFRVGDYRILYLIDDRNHEVVVYTILHRKDVYR